MNMLKITKGGGRLTVLLAVVCCIAAAVAGSGPFDDFKGTDVSAANTEWDVSQHVNTPVYTSGAVLTEAVFDARSATVSRSAETAWGGPMDSVRKLPPACSRRRSPISSANRS